MGVSFDGNVSLRGAVALPSAQASITIAQWVRNSAIGAQAFLMNLMSSADPAGKQFALLMLGTAGVGGYYSATNGFNGFSSVAGSLVNSTWQPAISRISGTTSAITKIQAAFGASAMSSDTVSLSNTGADWDRLEVGAGDSSEQAEPAVWIGLSDAEYLDAWSRFKGGETPETIYSAKLLTNATLLDLGGSALALSSGGSLASNGAGTLGVSATHPITRSSGGGGGGTSSLKRELLLGVG